MTKQFVVVLALLAALLAASLAWAQDEPESRDQRQSEEKVFNLIVGAEEEEEAEEEETAEPAYEPRIEPGRASLTLTLGYFSLSGTMFEHDNLIYKVTDDAYLYGDVSIESESAFNPILRAGYNLTTWFALEGQVGMTFAEYTASIANPMEVNPEGGSPDAVEQLGEFDRENRSALIAIGNVNGVFYPLNLDGDGRGRWHPYVTGGVGYALYNLDSDWIGESATSLNANIGGGLVLIADSMISVRVEALYHVHTVEFSPADVFQEREGGTVNVPVYEFDNLGNYGAVQEYGSNTLSGITAQVGFVLSF